MELGQKIRELREKKKLTQEDLGNAIGSKDPGGWGSQLERGIIENLKMDHIIKLANLLEVKPAFFFPDDIDNDKEEKLIAVEDPRMDFRILSKDPLKEKKSNKKIIQLLTEENRRLLRENAYLKSLLLLHKIDVYNTDYQNDTE